MSTKLFYIVLSLSLLATGESYASASTSQVIDCKTPNLDSISGDTSSQVSPQSLVKAIKILENAHVLILDQQSGEVVVDHSILEQLQLMGALKPSEFTDHSVECGL